MNKYELECTMNLSGFGECFDFLGVDATDFSVTDEALMMEERVQTFQKSIRRRKDFLELEELNALSELDFNDDRRFV